MSTNDTWCVGYCNDGEKNVKISSTDIFQKQGTQRKKVLTKYTCNSYFSCTNIYRCKYSPEVNTCDCLSPTITRT